MVVEIQTPQQLSRRQRWSHYLLIITASISFAVGYNLRDSVINALQSYTNVEAGISALYPMNWLLDTSGDYIFRVRDSARLGFKTTMQVSIRPIGQGTDERNIIDSFTLNRSQTLSNYLVLATQPFTLPDGTSATSVFYTFVFRESNPFVESIPVIVNGLDILTISRGQVIVITFQADKDIYDTEYPLFERFLRELDF